MGSMGTPGGGAPPAGPPPAVRAGRPTARRGPRRRVRGRRLGPLPVGFVDRDTASLAAADLVATGRATVDLAKGGGGVAVPDELVDDHHALARRAARGEQLVTALARHD